jgi:hypothetical protein
MISGLVFKYLKGGALGHLKRLGGKVSPLKEIALTAPGPLTFVVTGFFLISTSMWGQDESQTLRYAIRPNCFVGADGGQIVQRKKFLPQRRPKNPKITKTMTTNPTMYMIRFILFPSVWRVANDHLGNRSTPKFLPN